MYDRRMSRVRTTSVRNRIRWNLCYVRKSYIIHYCVLYRNKIERRRLLQSQGKIGNLREYLLISSYKMRFVNFFF